MFSKADDKKRSQTSPAGTVTPAPSAVDPESPTGAPPSVISESLRITGNLGSKGDIEVNGVVKGNIKCRRLTIGEKGTVRGELTADHVVVGGAVIGRIRAGTVTLAATARVEADIVTEGLAVALGARLEGHCGRSEGTDKPAAADGDRPASAARGARTDRAPRQAAVALAARKGKETPAEAAAQAAK